MPGEMSIKGEKVLEDGLKKLVNLFESEKEVLIAYLFGSYARGLKLCKELNC